MAGNTKLKDVSIAFSNCYKLKYEYELLNTDND